MAYNRLLSAAAHESGGALVSTALATALLVIGVPGGIAHAATNQGFRGAPVSQADQGGIASASCNLAPESRYLPARSGCVTVRRADLSGNGQTDLVLVYSLLTHTRFDVPGAPAAIRRRYIAKQAMLRVITPQGATITTTLNTREAAVLAVAHVSNTPGEAIFLQINEISSGSTADAYTLVRRRLVHTGYFGYGGDSGVQAGFNCLADPARLVQRVFIPLGSLLTAPWKETETIYAWHGSQLVKLSRRTLRHPSPLPHSEITVGSGCIHGIG